MKRSAQHDNNSIRDLRLALQNAKSGTLNAPRRVRTRQVGHGSGTTRFIRHGSSALTPSEKRSFVSSILDEAIAIFDDDDDDLSAYMSNKHDSSVLPVSEENFRKC